MGKLLKVKLWHTKKAFGFEWGNDKAFQIFNWLEPKHRFWGYAKGIDGWHTFGFWFVNLAWCW